MNINDTQFNDIKNDLYASKHQPNNDKNGFSENTKSSTDTNKYESSLEKKFAEKFSKSSIL